MTTNDDKEELDLSKASEMLLDECRMVLPGIQALFGFQLIAVFSERFAELATHLQRLHIAAIALVGIAVALIMTPAAFHRQRDPRAVDGAFVRVSTAMLLASMFPLGLAIALDLYIVAGMVIAWPQAALLAAALLLVVGMLWFVLPRWEAFQHALGLHDKDDH